MVAPIQTIHTEKRRDWLVALVRAGIPCGAGFGSGESFRVTLTLEACSGGELFSRTSATCTLDSGWSPLVVQATGFRIPAFCKAAAIFPCCDIDELLGWSALRRMTSAGLLGASFSVVCPGKLTTVRVGSEAGRTTRTAGLRCN